MWNWLVILILATIWRVLSMYMSSTFIHITGNGNDDANLLKSILKNSWNHISELHFWRVFSHLESLCRLGPTQTLDRPAKYYWNSIGCCELKCLSTVCTISFDMARFPGINFLLCLRILKLQGCLFQFQARDCSILTELVECILYWPAFIWQIK